MLREKQPKMPEGSYLVIDSRNQMREIVYGVFMGGEECVYNPKYKKQNVHENPNLEFLNAYKCIMLYGPLAFSFIFIIQIYLLNFQGDCNVINQ